MKTKFLILFYCIGSLFTVAQPAYYGELSLTKSYYYFDTITLDSTLRNYDITKATRFMASAMLFNDSVRFYSPWQSNGEGTLIYNNIPLYYTELLSSYQDTVERKENTSQTWEYNHEDPAKSFTVSFDNTMPTITMKHILPDLVNISNGFTIEYGAVTNADSIQVLIYNRNSTGTLPYSKTVSANSTYLTIPSEDLSSYIDSRINVIVSFIKEEFEAINEKQYKFTKRYNITRPVAFVE